MLAACAAGTDPGGTPAAGPAKPGGTLRIGMPVPPTAVDPVTMHDGSAIAIVQLVADYLIWLDSDFSLKPRLAEKWSAEKGNQQWAFTLRQVVTFSDGTPLDAAAVKASFDRLLDPAKNSAALAAFKTVLAQGGVSVRDSATVVFTLQRPFSDFPYLVSAGNYNAVILKSDYAGGFTSKAIGTGPFLLTDYNPSTGATLTRNPKYWQRGKPYLDGVRVKFYADAQAEQLALQGGDIDTLAITDPSVIQEAGDVVLDRAPATSMTALTLRVDQHPFDRKEVRQAIAYALDRPAVNDAVDNGIAQLANDHLFAPLFPSSPKEPSSRHVQVAVDGVVVADTRRPVLVFETRLPVRYYIPPEDVDLSRLVRSVLRTRCPYKGEARYWSVRGGPDNVVWTYPDPIPAAAAIRNHVAFYNEVVDITVDGEPVERPVTVFTERLTTR